MIAKLNFYHHPAPDELAGIFFEYDNKDSSIFLQIELKQMH